MSREETILKSLKLNEGEYIPPEGSKSARFIINDDYNEKLFSFIVNRFGITNEKLFRTKFDQAISGDGNEAKKMASVRSSSLCALLCFYDVEHNPITFKTDEGDVCFNKSFFEVKNRVFNNPSNMDVVLISEDNQHILFIESKFAEYLDNGSIEISDTYLRNEPSQAIYKKVLNKLIYKTNGKYKAAEEYQYVGGLKQIISHYVGLYNYKNREANYMSSYYHQDDPRLEVYKQIKRKIHFTEVVFKLEDFEDEFNKYHTASKKLFKILKDEDKDIDYITPTDYKTLFANDDNKNCLSEEIKTYYKLKKID